MILLKGNKKQTKYVGILRKDFTFSVSGIENVSEEDMNKLSALIINRR